MSQRIILTGTPGCGKTAIIRWLEMHGHDVIEEAATDVIALAQAQGQAEPWTAPVTFVDTIVALQKQRQIRAVKASTVQFYDRSPICTYALALYLGAAPSPLLLREIERLEGENIYHRQVFFVQNLGFCTPTEARKISYSDALRFETMHADTYAKFGYTCVAVPPMSLSERAQTILNQVHNAK